MESQEQFTNTISYIATCLSMLCGGTTSLFATYGSSFSEILGFTQYETNMVASLGDYAHYMSAPLFGYLSSRIGPTRIIQTAGVLMFCGYLGLGYAFKYFDTPQEHASHYVASMSLLFALVGVGSKAAYMSSMATTASNFKHSRYSGIALGIPLSLYGLSTFVFSSVKAHWFERDSTPARYLVFMASASAVAHLLAACFVTLKDKSQLTALSEEQVGQYKDRIVATQSFFSFASRLAVGYLSDVWRTRLRLPRAGLLVLAALLMIYAQMTAARVTRLEDLYTLAILIGMSMGSVFTLAPTITSETWGANNFGICWGIITLGPAIGGHVCNLIFGFSWDEGLVRIASRMGPETAQDRVLCDNECFAPAFVTTVKIAYLGLFFFTAVLFMPRILAVWRFKRQA
ncbi:hypothetical protein IWW55_001377 [Coemansia sp. RSA 2706]|nr:hypothetical protein IWW55_001377 [Coemansia sp. RSA 2706]